MSLNFKQTRDLLSNFQFSNLFIEELGWSKPSRQKPVTLKIDSYLAPDKTININQEQENKSNI